MSSFSKECYKSYFFICFICKFLKKTYLCSVFFIVLDFKVNKGWSTAVLLFYACMFRAMSPFLYFCPLIDFNSIES